MAQVEVMKEGEAQVAPAAPEPRRSTAERSVTAADGKVLTWRPLRTLERMDLNSIAGSQNALNLAWMADASIAFSVTSIDGKREPKPATMLELRALIQRIGDDGIDALAADAQASTVPEPKADEFKAQAGE